MVYFYNPKLLSFVVEGEKNDKGEGVFVDIVCRESAKKQKENQEKGYRNIPLLTVKLKGEDTAEKIENMKAGIFDMPAFITSYKKTNKNGKVNITARITSCAEGKGNIGWVAAIPIKGYVQGLGYDQDLEPIKYVLKYVDKFEFEGESYTQILYVVGRASNKITNLCGAISVDTARITKGDTVETYTTELRFLNEEIEREDKLIKTDSGPELVENTKKVKDFTSLANAVVEGFAREFKPHKSNSNNNRNYNKSHNHNKNGDLVIPEYPGKETERNNKKRRHK